MANSCLLNLIKQNKLMSKFKAKKVSSQISGKLEKQFILILFNPMIMGIKKRWISQRLILFKGKIFFNCLPVPELHP